jgi:hypothetical protein
MNRPNIVLIYTDRQRWDTIADGVMDRLAHTPDIFDLKGGSRRKATQLS